MTRTRIGTFAMTIALAALFAPTPARARHTLQVGDGVPDSIRYYESVAMMSPLAAASTQAAGGPGVKIAELSFYTLGRQFDLKLEAHDPFAPGATVRWVDDGGEVVEPAPGGVFFRGRVEGDATSWVRLTMRGDALAGVVMTGDEMYFLEPASRFFGEGVAASETLAYRLSDTDSEWIPGSCAATQHAPRRGRKSAMVSATRALQRLLGKSHFVAAAAGTLKQADLGMIADNLYFNKHGSSSAADIAEIINNVDGIYQAEIGVTVQILTTVIFTSAGSDPFSATTDPQALLPEVRVWRDNNDNNPSQAMWGTDLAHLITARDFNGTTIGIAYIDAVCDPAYAAGTDQDYTNTANLLTLLFAHEMGHNFGAFHDAQASGSCSCCAGSPGTFIMNPVLSGSLQPLFSTCSKSFINPAVSSFSCLADAGPTSTPTSTPTATPTPTPTLGVPSITNPSSGQSIGVEGVSFAWTAVGGATAYDLRVLNASTQATVFTGTLSGGGSTSTLIGLPNNGSYTFRVRACRAPVSDATCGAFASRNFIVSLIAPSAAPTITFPAPGAMFTTSQQTLQWTTVTGNPMLPDMFYEVRLTHQDTGQTELQLRTIHPTAQTDVILASLPYRMQVRACQAGCGPYSAAVDFSVALGPVPTSAPTITNASVSNGNTLDVSWTPVAGAEWYQVQVVQPRPAGPGGGALTVAARQVAGTSVTLPVPAGQASVIVAACNGDGCGPYSGAAGISPTGPNPSTPQLGSPLDGSVVNGPSMLFTWSRIPGDTGNTVYRLYVQDMSRQRAAVDAYTTQNFFAALLNAEGGKYGALVIANPGPSQIAGPPVTFTVRGASAVAPTLMAPTHASTVPAGNILLGWTPVPGATLYEYLVSVQGAAASSGRGVTPGIFVQVPLVAVNGQGTVYNGIVRACPAGQTCTAGSDAGWGPWSSAAGSGVVSFTVTP